MAATLESLAAQGRRLLDASGDAVSAHCDFGYWNAEVAEWLDEVGAGTGLSSAWSALNTSPLVMGNGYYDDPRSWTNHYQAVRGRLHWLASVPTQLAAKKVSVLELDSASRKQRTNVLTKKVFLVHGHDVEARETTARFLEKLGCNCIILHERPNGGRTIIEKFEEYSDVSFAVVLLTPDDVGGLFEGAQTKQKARARQNVILELGFFLGALGRAKVCALYCDGVEIPSDYSGVAFVPMDPSGAWKLALVRELKAAGISVDANLAV